MENSGLKGVFINGIVQENPIFRLVLGLCPTIAVTTSLMNAAGMGAAATFVLICSNMLISLLRNFIPDKVRIPSFIVIIAMFVTVVQMLMQGFLPELNNSLGIFIPLIVVNCIILARAESFASKNGVVASAIDGIGMGLGFTIALMAIAFFRELIGSGQLFGVSVLGEDYPQVLLFILAPGGFLVLGVLMAVVNKLISNKQQKGEHD